MYNSIASEIWQVEALERRADVFEDQLAREIDNGRLLRILIKLGVVNERPEWVPIPTYLFFNYNVHTVYWKKKL